LYRGGQSMVGETGGPGENHWPASGLHFIDKNEQSLCSSELEAYFKTNVFHILDSIISQQLHAEQTKM
jgi:hypothetical protein